MGLGVLDNFGPDDVLNVSVQADVIVYVTLAHATISVEPLEGELKVIANTVAGVVERFDMFFDATSP